MGRKRKADTEAAAEPEEKVVDDAPASDAEADDDVTDDNENAEEEEGAGDVLPAKRGRGRPKSAAPKADADDKPVDSGPKRGRGRPRKAVERLEYTTMTSGRPSRRSDRVREINSPSGSSGSSGSSALELRRLTLVQKRLSLERERFALEQERLEMDRNNWDTLNETLSAIASHFEKDGLNKVNNE